LILKEKSTREKDQLREEQKEGKVILSEEYKMKEKYFRGKDVSCEKHIFEKK